MEVFLVNYRTRSVTTVMESGTGSRNAHQGGEYFLQRMNREDYARRKMQFESSRAGSARVTRSRR